MKCVAAILAPQDSFMVLNLYSNGYSAVLGETVVKQAFGINAPTDITGNAATSVGTYPSITCGELVLQDSFGKNLPLSIFVRMRR